MLFQVTPPLQSLLTVDCNGGISLFPDMPWGLRINATTAKFLADFATDRLWKRTSCACPQMGKPEFFRRFTPGLLSILNFMSGTNKDLSQVFSYLLSMQRKAANLKFEL